MKTSAESTVLYMEISQEFTNFQAKTKTERVRKLRKDRIKQVDKLKKKYRVRHNYKIVKTKRVRTDRQTDKQTERHTKSAK